MSKCLLRIALVLLLASSTTYSNGPLRSASEIRLALKRLSVVGSVLYIAAHPDDENTALLATFARGRGYRTGYLSLTRGEGGQNLIGDEQGQLLGMIRTQELLAARRIDGAEQWFTRAIDFGYSKTSDETMRIWNQKDVLSDIVRIVRTFRPDVIIARFGPTAGGHGNHTASAILAESAFTAAADRNEFPDQLTTLRPWKATRLVWNAFRPSAADSLWQERMHLRIDVGEYSPLLGKSFSELAGEARSMHKSQGFGAAQNRGTMVNYFQHIAGVEARTDLFDGITTTWARMHDGASVDSILANIILKFDDEHPENSVPGLMMLLQRIDRLPDAAAVAHKRNELTEIIRACSGLWFEATTSEYSVVPGSSVSLTFSALRRRSIPWTLDRLFIPFGSDTLLSVQLEDNKPYRMTVSCPIPKDAPLTNPYWRANPHSIGTYAVDRSDLIGLPEAPSPFSVGVRMSSPYGILDIGVQARQKRVDPVEGELFRPLTVVPAITINPAQSVILADHGKTSSIDVVLRASTPSINGSIRLELPDGWTVVPRSQSFSLDRRDDEIVVRFAATPTKTARAGEYSVHAEVNGETFDQSLQTANYGHIPPQSLFRPARGKLLLANIKIRGSHVGYVMGAGDDVPQALRQMGFTVTLLDDADLAKASFSTYDAIIAGVRAFNTRPALRIHQKRVLEYVRQGGTFLVQYITTQRGESEDIGPFPLTISRDRVTEEDAAVRFLAPKHPLLNVPNKISDTDFVGWIQERGLYFGGKWDDRYETVIASHDTGEPELAGGLITTNYGKGVFIYSGLAFFRQLPAGVVGAYRLFANLVSARSSDHSSKARTAR